MKPGTGDEGPPPFAPDPRLVAYLEGGSKKAAEERFKAEIEKQELRRRT